MGITAIEQHHESLEESLPRLLRRMEISIHESADVLDELPEMTLECDDMGYPAPVLYEFQVGEEQEHVLVLGRDFAYDTAEPLAGHVS